MKKRQQPPQPQQKGGEHHNQQQQKQLQCNKGKACKFKRSCLTGEDDGASSAILLLACIACAPSYRLQTDNLIGSLLVLFQYPLSLSKSLWNCKQLLLIFSFQFTFKSAVLSFQKVLSKVSFSDLPLPSQIIVAIQRFQHEEDNHAFPPYNMNPTQKSHSFKFLVRIQLRFG